VKLSRRALLALIFLSLFPSGVLGKEIEGIVVSWAKGVLKVRGQDGKVFSLKLSNFEKLRIRGDSCSPVNFTLPGTILKVNFDPKTGQIYEVEVIGIPQ
jgi:hypothetical protein